MTSTIQLKTIIPSLFIAFTLLCFTAAPKAFGVSPPPDGGYPGGNTAEGQSALFSRTTGGYNTAVGYLSLRSDATGSFNTAVGAGTLLANIADSNTATGGGALFSNTTGSNNTANGAFALFANTDGGWNTAFGSQTLVYNTTGAENTAVGSYALAFNTEGLGNVAVGRSALYNNTTGVANIGIGTYGGANLTTGSGNIDIDNAGLPGENYTIRIGRSGVQSTYIAGIAGATVGAGGTTCYVDNDGKLGVYLSARRFKTDIADMAAASEAILCLHPVTFHYKPELDKTGIPQFGLVAEEVVKANPDLVTRDRDGKLQTVRYEAVNVMLLNEFLKEHRKVQEQQATINELKSTVAQQQEGMKAFAATLKEQASQIQRLSAQVEVNRPASQTVLNND
jgi:Chaperone of endosialidase